MLPGRNAGVTVGRSRVGREIGPLYRFWRFVLWPPSRWRLPGRLQFRDKTVSIGSEILNEAERVTAELCTSRLKASTLGQLRVDHALALRPVPLQGGQGRGFIARDDLASLASEPLPPASETVGEPRGTLCGF